VRALGHAGLVRGNHDKVCCGLESPDGFNAVARAAALWTQAALTPGNRDWVAALPRGPLAIDDTLEICHGSPSDEDEYIFGSAEARHALFRSSRPVCLFGHTHYPAVFYGAHGQLEGSRIGNPGEMIVPLLPGMRYLINPGSVGQPRDGDARAAYGIVDTTVTTVELWRVEYAVELAQQKIRDAGLPAALADRLGVGR
jgi:diadenosine tetraphosphatase ApaH/serine/threonine PP2A family protein phosphatase